MNLIIDANTYSLTQIFLASSSDTSQGDWKLPPNYPLILPFGAIIGHPLLTIIQTETLKQQDLSMSLPWSQTYHVCILHLFSLDIVISRENYIPKQNKYSHKVNKRVDQPIIQNLMYFRRGPYTIPCTLYCLKYSFKYSFSMCAFSHSPSVEKQEYLKGRYHLSLKEILKSKIEP